MKSLKLIAKGRVQRVGYRNYIDSVAFELEVKGYVKNLEDGTVEIIAQHEQGDILEKLAGRAKITEYPISVNEIKKEYVDVSPFEKFEILRGDPAKEQAERLDEAAFYLMKVHGSNKEISSKLDTTNNKLDSFANATADRFDVVDKKYGKISDRLDRISDSLERLVDILEAFKPK